MAAIRGLGLPLGLGAQPTNEYSLAGGETMLIPAGMFVIGLGQYTSIEVWDSVLQNWRIIGNNPDRAVYIDSDGVNSRVVNRTGCVAGAMITNHGSGYIAPTCTASAGGSKWAAIVGGQVATSQPIPGGTGGSGYTYPPRCVIPAPTSATPGVQATATCTLSSGVANAVTIINQGAGYRAPVVLTFVTDPRDPSTNIVPATPLTLTIGGAGVLSGLICTDMGNPVTAAPTLTIADSVGLSASATALMCFAVTGYTVSNGGSFHAGTFITTSGGILTSTPADTNPANQGGIIGPRPAKIVPALSANAIVASASTPPLAVEDWGWGFQLTPTLVPVDGTGLATTAVTTLVATVGAQTDTFWIQPLRG